MEDPEDINELIAGLVQTPAEIEGLVQSVSPDSLQTRSEPGDFSLLENVCHLRDIEIEGYQHRIRSILEEECPLLPDVDGTRLAIERDYNNDDLETALQNFRSARQENVKRLHGVGPDQLSRMGFLEFVCEVTIGGLLEKMW
jgi:hypothetical protein